MLLASRFRRLEFVEHRLGSDVQGDLLQVRVGIGLDAHPVSDPRHQRDQPGGTWCSATRLICTARMFRSSTGARAWAVPARPAAQASAFWRCPPMHLSPNRRGQGHVAFASPQERASPPEVPRLELVRSSARRRSSALLVPLDESMGLPLAEGGPRHFASLDPARLPGTVRPRPRS
jgi:hypothetical protein